jgi:hypothetical protein
MATYSVLDANVVVNIILANSKEEAESITGKKCIEFTSNALGVIGATWDGERFIDPPSQFNIEE